MLTSLLSAEEVKYSIQVLSVKDKRSITDLFMSKLKSVNMSHMQKYIDGQYKVLIGNFDTYKAASSRLPLVREKVNTEAFVRPMHDEYLLDPKQNMQKAMLMAQARTLKKMKDEERVTKEEMLALEPIKVSVLQEKPLVKETVRKSKEEDDTKREGKSSENSSQSLVCKKSKKALRESEISEALSFYKKSVYYKFMN